MVMVIAIAMVVKEEENDNVEMHLHRPDGASLVADFEDHGAPPSKWRTVMAEARQAQVEGDLC